MITKTDLLPIDSILASFLETLAQTKNVVLVAPPGAGKTTRVPLALLNEPWINNGKIILLEPRRLAAYGAAQRMADILGEKVGETVGLRVRLGSKISAKTRIEVVTEGVFARMILDDPELSGISAVIFDEFHERSLDADFGLALALDAQSGLREDLRITVMSATLDGARVASLLGTSQGPAPIIESEGRIFPIETRYIGRNPAKRLEEDVTASICMALREETGSILVFLPGQGEIRRTEALLRDSLSVNTKWEQNVDIAPLYGQLERSAQQLAIQPSPTGRRKVVLATSIAETSLTIEGVRVVIDTGLSRVPRYEPDIGITRLETVRSSRAATDQRRGRAGRTQPGICLRLWAEAANGAFSPFSQPEILSADLAPLLLDCAAWGVDDPTKLSFLDPPPVPAIIEARRLLQSLGALDSDNRITDLGRSLQSLPLPPRLARMIIKAREVGEAATAAEIAAVLVERGLGGNSIDLSDRINQFRRDRSPRAYEMRRLASIWSGKNQQSAHSIGRVIALAYPDRIAKLRGKEGAYVLANGRGAMIDPSDSLAREPFLAVAEITGSAASARIISAAPITRNEIEQCVGAEIVESIETTFDINAKALRSRRIKRLGAIHLEQHTLPTLANNNGANILAKGIADLGISQLPWSKGLEQWRTRIAFLRQSEDNTALWPNLTDEALKASINTWLAPYLTEITSLSNLSSETLEIALKALLPWDAQQLLDKEAPTHFVAPTGSRIPIDYTGDTPSIAIRVQELFGLDSHPTIANGRIALTLELLSPAHRPIQITRDLPGFWQGSWSSVRSEMRGRYPKHPWPEDPASAAATTRAKPRGQ